MIQLVRQSPDKRRIAFFRGRPAWSTAGRVSRHVSGNDHRISIGRHGAGDRVFAGLFTCGVPSVGFSGSKVQHPFRRRQFQLRHGTDLPRGTSVGPDGHTCGVTQIQATWVRQGDLPRVCIGRKNTLTTPHKQVYPHIAGAPVVGRNHSLHGVNLPHYRVKVNFFFPNPHVRNRVVGVKPIGTRNVEAAGCRFYVRAIPYLRIWVLLGRLSRDCNGGADKVTDSPPARPQESQ